MSAAVCVIVKNELPYLEEWLDHNFRIGFDEIYIYDNSDNFDLRLFQRRGVTVIHFPGPTKQTLAYTDFANKYAPRFTWMALIDADEFIVVRPQFRSIKIVLQEHCPRGALALNWLMFGSNGHQDYSPEPVTKRFTRRAASVNLHVKVIVKTSDFIRMTSPHSVETHYGTQDTTGKRVNGPFNPNGPIDVACIHHYFTKSANEFRAKIARGRSDIVQKRTFQEFVDFDKTSNEVEDLSLAAESLTLAAQ